MYRLEKVQAKQITGGLSFWTFSAGAIMLVNAISGLINAGLDIKSSLAATGGGSDDENNNKSYKSSNYRSRHNDGGWFRLGLKPSGSSFSFPSLF